MKKIIALAAAALLALGAQAAPGGHGLHGGKAAKLAQPKSKATPGLTATPPHKAGAKSLVRKQGGARKHAAAVKPAHKAPRRHG